MNGASGSAAATVLPLLVSWPLDAKVFPKRSLFQLILQLQSAQFSGLLDIKSLQGDGQLLFQGGRCVHAQFGDLGAAEAASTLTRQSGDSQVTVVKLGAESQALACAAVDGRPESVRTVLGAERPRLIAELTRANYEGSVALETGDALLVWWLRAGVRTSGPAWPGSVSGCRLTQLRWTPRALPTVAFSEARDELEGLPGAPEPPDTGDSGPGADLLWLAFEEAMAEHLDERAARFVNLMRRDHAHKNAQELRQFLAGQVRRVAGAEQAGAFLKRVS